ncbi:MAG: ABC transporter substrate-binding protein [Armatimonadetes bacterium]|nr:ABC transporter substrate-binding protein [Anaerolineae bacterium]
MKKTTLVLSLVLTVMVLLVSLLTPSLSLMQTAPTSTPIPTITPVPLASGATEITFWYGLGGNLGNVVLETVNKYNLSQSTYYVNPIFQSSYDDTINKINASLASGDLPDLVQVFEAGTQRMIDTGRIVPVETLFVRDGLEAVIEDMEPAVRANYTVNGTLYSAPFNSSTAMLYINRAAFIEAGLNPDEPLVTFDDILAAAAALTVKDGDTTTRYGIGLYPEGWFFEQIHAVHDELMGAPTNGRAERMTAYSYNDAIGVQWLDFQKQMIDEGSAIYYGPGGSNAALAAFANGEVGMVFSSIASLRGIVGAAANADKGVEVGTVYMPRNPDAAGKTIVGGASLWITDAGDAAKQEGAWDFIKFALTPEIQAFWAANTGYFPVVQAAYDQPEMAEALVNFPQFQVAVDQIRLADITDANTAHISGTFVPMRQDVIKAMDDFWTGKVATAQEALDAAVAASNELLEEYNLANAQ